MEREFDAIVVGTGQSGPSLATRLAGSGRKVAIIERQHFGGTCVNDGCIPTKTLVASARAAYVARRAEDFGIKIDGAVSVDMHKVKARKDSVVLLRVGEHGVQGGGIEPGEIAVGADPMAVLGIPGGEGNQRAPYPEQTSCEGRPDFRGSRYAVCRASGARPRAGRGCRSRLRESPPSGRRYVPVRRANRTPAAARCQSGPAAVMSAARRGWSHRPA